MAWDSSKLDAIAREMDAAAAELGKSVYALVQRRKALESAESNGFVLGLTPSDVEFLNGCGISIR